jgi:hypothetical protein
MKREKDVLAMVYVLEVLALVMLISMGIAVSMLSALIIVANMVFVIWKHTVVSVMKGGLVK